MPEGIHHFADTLGIVAKNMALGLKPFGTGLFIGPKSGISSDLEFFHGMLKIEHFNIGVEAFGDRPIALFAICGDHQFQVSGPRHVQRRKINPYHRPPLQRRHRSNRSHQAATDNAAFMKMRSL